MKALRVLGNICLGTSLFLLLCYFSFIMALSTDVVTNTVEENLDIANLIHARKMNFELNEDRYATENEEIINAIIETDAFQGIFLTQTENILDYIIENRVYLEMTEAQIGNYVNQILRELEEQEILSANDIIISREEIEIITKEINNEFAMIREEFSREEIPVVVLSTIGRSGKILIAIIILVNSILLFLINKKEKKGLTAIIIPTIFAGIIMSTFAYFAYLLTKANLVVNVSTEMDILLQSVLERLFIDTSRNGVIIFSISIILIIINIILSKKYPLKENIE